MSEAVSSLIIERCLGLGFAAAGVAPAQPSRWAPELRAWLAAGHHGTMAYLAKDVEIRQDPRGILNGARSFLVVADQYSPRGSLHPSRLTDDRPMGRIARYAQGRNYHDVMKRRLHKLADALRLEHPGSEFRTCVDTAPVLEREIAVLAGVGWQAKNTMVINPRLGSYLFLGVVATTMDLAPPREQWGATDHCGSCTRCIDACPTRAIEPYRVDGSRCISYLTIERRESIPDEFHAGLGDWLYGCDVCQDVCPHNSAREDAGTAFEAYSPRTPYLDIVEVLGWTREAREEAFKVSPMKRASLSMIKRNAIIVAGNALRARPDRTLHDRIRAIASDQSESPLVRNAARDVLTRLDQTPGTRLANE